MIHGASRDDYREDMGSSYLALDEDYGAIKGVDIAEKFTPFLDKTGIICAAMERGGGIRVLRQEPWETLCSFIVSQKQQYAANKKIIAALSEAYGEKFECKTEAGERIVCSAFPDAGGACRGRRAGNICAADGV